MFVLRLSSHEIQHQTAIHHYSFGAEGAWLACDLIAIFGCYQEVSLQQ